MRQVAYKKHDLALNRGRVISVRENIAENDSDTSVVKNFVYLVTRVDAVPTEIPQPQIRIIKRIDNQQHYEGFIFRVKGIVFIKKNRLVYQIRYGHSLNVQILWKTHVLSSDKPAALA